jgi:hypothetical protein
MKKVIIKSTVAVVAVVAASLGAWKAQDAYGNEDNSMLMENVEALSNDEFHELKPIWVVDKTGFCFQYYWTGKTRINERTKKKEYFYEAEIVGGINNTWATCKPSTSVDGIDKCTPHDCLVGEPYDKAKEGWRTVLSY